jgi:hypothetical protein
VFSAADAARLVRETDCDAVLFARGALGNPFLFAEARRLFAGLPPGPGPSPAERFQAALRQLAGAPVWRPLPAGIASFCAYTRGFLGRPPAQFRRSSPAVADYWVPPRAPGGIA